MRTWMKWTLGIMLTAGMWTSGYIVGKIEWLDNEQFKRTALVNAAGDVVAASISAREVEQRRADHLQVIVDSLRRELLPYRGVRNDQLGLGWWLAKDSETGGYHSVCTGTDRPTRKFPDGYLVGLWTQAINLKIELARNSPCGP